MSTEGSQVHPDSALPSRPTESALDTQVGGNHYSKLAIQPVEYCYANRIPFMEGCAIKYLTRWRDKGGIADLEKARHFIDMLIEFETKRSAVHSDVKTTTRCDESVQCNHRWTWNPGSGDTFCGTCLVNFDPRLHHTLRCPDSPNGAHHRVLFNDGESHCGYCNCKL
jgi:hypothetical protein